MITVGDKSRWWNRSVPILRIASGVVLLLIAVELLPYLAYPASDLWWGVTHHWTAEYRGRTFRLPFMWRQEEQQLGGTFYFRNAIKPSLTYLGSDLVSVHDSTSDRFDAAVMAGRNRQHLPQRALMGDEIENTWGDLTVNASYDCAALHNPQRRSYQIFCFGRDGRWIVDMLGSESSLGDFKKILASVSKLPDPVPWPK